MTEPTTRADVIGKIGDELQHRITLAELVDWAEQVVMEGDFAEGDHGLLRHVAAQLGVADVRALGLTREDCEQLLDRLGYRAEVTLRPAI